MLFRSGKGFTDLFDALITSWSIAEFIGKGWLSAFDYVSIRADSREQQIIDSLKKRGVDGDYQVKEMNEVLNRQVSIRRLYESVERYAAGKKGIPVFGSEIEQVKVGCLASVGLDYIELGKQTGRMAAKVLKGEAKASEMNFEIIEGGSFYGNTAVAENLGIQLPDSLVADAADMFHEITVQ